MKYLIIILLFITEISFGHDNEFECIYIYCRDCSYEDSFIPHHHSSLTKFPSISDLDSISEKKPTIVFDSIYIITDEDINNILLSKITSFSLKNVEGWSLKQLEKIMKKNADNEYIRRIDEVNNVPNKSSVDDSLILFQGMRLYQEAFFNMYSIILKTDTSISDEYAEILSSYRGTYLQLNNLIKLSDNQAKILSRFKGYKICMPDLNEQSRKIYDSYREKYYHYKGHFEINYYKE